jgi:hypothetical protein
MLVGFALLPLVLLLLLMLAVLPQVEPLLLHGTMPLLLILMLVGLAMLLLMLVVLLMVLLLHVFVLVGSRLLAFARRGLQLAVLVNVAVLRWWYLVLVVGKELAVLLPGTPWHVLVVVGARRYY